VVYGGSRGTSPSLDLTFPPTCLSENLGEWKGGGEGKGRVGGPPALLPPTGFRLKYHPGYYHTTTTIYKQTNNNYYYYYYYTTTFGFLV